jgi:hypothetical protein
MSVREFGPGFGPGVGFGVAGLIGCGGVGLESACISAPSSGIGAIIAGVCTARIVRLRPELDLLADDRTAEPEASLAAANRRKVGGMEESPPSALMNP